jgi:hypothetical protein
MLRKNEQKLLARYLIQFMQLQAGNASPRELALWRQKVRMAFSERRIRKAVKLHGETPLGIFGETESVLNKNFMTDASGPMDGILTIFPKSDRISEPDGTTKINTF